MLRLDPDAVAYFNSLPPEVRMGFYNSNLTFRTVDDLKEYHERNLNHLSGVLYSQLPDPAIPSNAAYDPLDSQEP